MSNAALADRRDTRNSNEKENMRSGFSSPAPGDFSAKSPEFIWVFILPSISLN